MYKKVFLITFIMILLSISIVYCISEEYLTPKEEKGLWGFSDPNGVFVIDPKWKTVEYFRNGTAFVSLYDYDDYYNKKSVHIVCNNNEYTKLVVEDYLIKIKTNQKYPFILKYINCDNVFVCDFVNKDFFWLNVNKKSCLT